MSHTADNPACGTQAEGTTGTVTMATGGGAGSTPSKFKSFRVKDLVQGGADNEGNAAHINKILRELDQNGDGVINASELVNMLDGVVKARRERRYMIFIIIALFVFSLCTVGAVVGLTYAVVDALKDTQVTGDTMYVKGSTVDVVRTGSAEFAVVDGVFVNRQVQQDNATSTTASNTTSLSPNAVMRAASYMGSPQAFTSRVDVRTLMELKYLYIKGTGSVEMALVVHGVARVPMEGSVMGTVVRILTTAGTITLDDTVLMFSSDMADVFAESGFKVSRNRRVLLGFYDILGFFNFIEDLTVFDLPPNEPKPALPSKNFFIKFEVLEPCVLPSNATNDRCIFHTKDKPADSGIDPVYPPQPNSPPPSPPVPGIPEADVNAPFTTKVFSNDEPFAEGDNNSNRRRGRFLRTTPHQRGLQDAGADSGSFIQDLAGVVLVDGTRYMAHNETATVWEGASRTEYEYALVKGYRKIEVVPAGSEAVYKWQQRVVFDDKPRDGMTLFCTNYSIPSEFFSSAAQTGNTIASFSYMGLETVDGRAARHFKLTLKQPEDSKIELELPATVTVDYYDSVGTFEPLAYTFDHPYMGRVHIRVLEFRALTADSPEAALALFQAPAESACEQSVSVPRMLSPFRLRDVEAVVRTDQDPPESERRLMLDQSAERVAIWNTLDHINGTGEWPEWALAAYGGERPSVQRRLQLLGNERELLDGGDRSLVTVAFGTTCTKGPVVNIPAGPCSVSMGSSGSSFAIEGVCASNAYKGIIMKGSMSGDGCAQVAKGCVTVAISVSASFFKKLGVEDIDLASVCLGYDFDSKTFFFDVTVILWMGVAKVEVCITFKFNYCCIWIESVTIEGFLGVDLGFYSFWASIITITVVEDVYLKGSASIAGKPPLLVNRAQTLATNDGLWGDWKDEQYCGQLQYSLSDSGRTRIWGQPMNGFGLRMEAQQGSGDDTTLNGVSVACLNGGWVDVEKGYFGAWWYQWVAGGFSRRCANGGYFVGAKARMEYRQPDDDDTALNSIMFLCSGGDYWSPHFGFYGTWTSWVNCPDNTYVCGLSVRFESDRGSDGDDTTMNALKLTCCTW